MNYMYNEIGVERRQFARIKIEKPCVLYAKQEELNAKIIDISESGVLIKFNENSIVSDLFKLVGNIIQFSSMDTYKNYTRRTETSIFSGEMCIVRSGKDYIGCEFTRPDKYLTEYIKNKKITAFVNSGFKLAY